MTLPTDLDLIQAAAAAYDPAAVPVITDINSAVRVFRSISADGATILAIEGTHDFSGWSFDFLALETNHGHPGTNDARLGWVHVGFKELADAIMPRLALQVASAGPYAICGHSLGAALALLCGALLSLDGTPPVKIGAFAPPRVGGTDLMQIVTAMPWSAFRFGDDIVPEVPLSLPGFPYVQLPLTELPDGNLPRLDRFAAHHWQNYLQGVESMSKL